MLRRPEALLLDFGGVLADAPPQRVPPPDLVLKVYNLIGGSISPGEIQHKFVTGALAYEAWRDQDHPDEMPAAEVWDRFILDGWPRTAQASVRVQLRTLTYDWAWRNNWALRPGVPEMLDAAREIPLAVVSNTICGAAHRDFLARAGVGHRFAVQIYSDEAEVRKPNPQMIWHATDALGVDPRRCWFVGDTRRRDVVCARRADVAAAILMRSPRTEAGGAEPDALVEDGFGVLELLQRFSRWTGG